MVPFDEFLGIGQPIHLRGIVQVVAFGPLMVALTEPGTGFVRVRVVVPNGDLDDARSENLVGGRSHLLLQGAYCSFELLPVQDVRVEPHQE